MAVKFNFYAIAAVLLVAVDLALCQVYSNNIFRGNDNLKEYSHLFNGGTKDRRRNCRTDHDCGENMHCSVPLCICNPGYINNGPDACTLVNFMFANCKAGQRPCSFNSDCSQQAVEICGPDRCCQSLTSGNDTKQGDHNHTPSPLPGHLGSPCFTGGQCGTNMHCKVGKCACNGGYIANGTFTCQIDKSQLCQQPGLKQCSDNSDCTREQKCGDDHCCQNANLTTTQPKIPSTVFFHVKRGRFCASQNDCGSNQHCSQFQQKCVCNSGYVDDGNDGCRLSNEPICSWGSRSCRSSSECWFGAECGQDKCCHTINNFQSSSTTRSAASYYSIFVLFAVSILRI